MGAECVGEFTVYKKGWFATLHRNPVKNLILFSYLPTQNMQVGGSAIASVEALFEIVLV